MRTVGRALLVVTILVVILTLLAARARAMPDAAAAAGDAAALAVTITCPADKTVGTGSEACSASVSFAATATPGLGCKLLGIAYAIGSTQITSPHRFSVGTTTVTAAAADSCGGTATCEFDVRVLDTMTPSPRCPANITVDAATGGCSQSVSFAATATDNCSVASLKYYDGATEISSPHIFYVGINTVRAEARDPSGNMSACRFTVTVRDTQSPHITCPANITTNADSGRCTASVSFAASATDNCPVWPVRYYSGTAEISSPYAFTAGTSTVRAETRDATGNTASCSFQVTVRDTQPPVLTCPAEQVASNDPGRCSATVENYSVNARDNCGVLSIWESPVPGSGFPVGSTPVTITVSDRSDNSSTCTFPLTVRDTEPPALTCPAEVTVTTDAGLCSATLPLTATASDNCGLAWVRYYSGTVEMRSPHTFPLGLTSVRVAARDAASNTAECSYRVTVTHHEPPSITCPPAVRTSPDPGADHASGVVTGVATALDPCGVARVSGERSDGLALADPYPLGRTIITWTARDAAGNAASCTQEVRVEQGPLLLYLPCIVRR